jgi:hypothetical protein
VYQKQLFAVNTNLPSAAEAERKQESSRYNTRSESMLGCVFSRRAVITILIYCALSGFSCVVCMRLFSKGLAGSDQPRLTPVGWLLALLTCLLEFIFTHNCGAAHLKV